MQGDQNVTSQQPYRALGHRDFTAHHNPVLANIGKGSDHSGH